MMGKLLKNTNVNIKSTVNNYILRSRFEVSLFSFCKNNQTAMLVSNWIFVRA